MPTNDGLCYWCGAPPTGVDHPVPRSFFLPPRPQLITVPACDVHNRGLREDEEYFRAVALSFAYPSPAAVELWTGPVRRSFERTPAFRKMVGSQIQDVSLYTPSGIYLGDSEQLVAEGARVNRFLEKLIRGLRFHHEGTRFGEVSVEGFRIAPETTMQLPDLSALPPNSRSIGSALKYRFGITEDDPDVSLWALLFFDKAMFVVGTRPAEEAG